jgi:hypothetical protein
MYIYESEVAEVFTRSGQEMFLKIRDNVHALLKTSGVISMWEAISGATGNSWTMLACVDRMVELGEIREVNCGPCSEQDRIFTRAADAQQMSDAQAAFEGRGWNWNSLEPNGFFRDYNNIAGVETAILRDKFAMAALNGFGFQVWDDADTTYEDWAVRAYEIADAMMAARKPKEEK